MSEKQFDILIGISRNMEKSLRAIEDGMNKKSDAGSKSSKGGNAGAAVGGMSASISVLISSVSKFNEKKGAIVIDFIEELGRSVSKIDSGSAKEFGEFAEGMGKAFEVLFSMMSIGKIIKLQLAARVLFGGKKSLLSRIVTGMQNAFKDIDGKNAAEGAKALKDIAEGINALAKGVGMLALLALAAPFVIIGALVARAVVGMFVGIGKKGKQIADGARGIKLLGKGLAFLAAGIALMALTVAVAGPKLIFESIIVIGAYAMLFALIGKVDRSIRQGARAIALVGLALFGFAAGMATLMLAVMIATPKMILEGILLLGAFALTFALIGLADKYIAQGALVMIGVAIALFLFSGGLMIFGLALELFTWEKALLGGLLIAEIGMALFLIGKFGKQIDQGALIMAGMGVGLAVFSVGLLIFGLAVKLFDWESALLGAVLIVGIGLAAAAIGGVAAYVIPGAIALAALGVGLVLFSVGVMIFGLAIKAIRAMFDDLGEAGMIAGGLILGFGLAVGALGIIAPLVVAGGAALSAMGTGLMLFSIGILIFAVAIKLIKALFGDDLMEAGIIAGAILMGFGIAIGALGVIAPLIVLGSASLATMGVGLIVFSLGLLAFAGAYKVFEKAVGGVDNMSKAVMSVFLPLGLTFSALGVLAPVIILGAVSLVLMGASLLAFSLGLLAFSGAVVIYGKAFGGIENAAQGILDIFLPLGVAFGALGLAFPAILLGTLSATLLSSSLVALGGGLIAFSLAAKYITDNDLIEDTKFGKMLKGIATLPGIALAISAVGVLSFNPFFVIGVATSMGIGATLASIGTGLGIAAAALAGTKDLDKLIENIFGDTGLIPAIAKAFSKIGKDYGGGLLSSFFGADDVSVGIRVTRGFGDVLQELAGGIVAFANFTEFPVKVPDPKDPSKLIYQTVDILGDVVPKLTENLPTLLTALASAFATIGEKYGGEEGFFGTGDSPVQKGIGAVKGLGAVLQELAGGIVAFANFEEFPIQVPDPKDPSKLIYKVVNLFDTLPKIKAALVGDGTIMGKVTGKTGILMGLAEVFAEIGNKYGDGFFSDGPVKKGVEAVQGIGGVVSELAQGIIAFANMQRGLPNYDAEGKFNGTYTPFSLEDVKNNITGVLTSLPSVFANIDIDAMEELGASGNIASSMGNIEYQFDPENDNYVVSIDFDRGGSAEYALDPDTVFELDSNGGAFYNSSIRGQM